MSDSGGQINRFFKHSTIYAIGNILNRIGAFLLLPIYTNYLSVAEYGALELFYATTAVITGLLSVGIAHATLRFYFNYEKQEDRNLVVSTNFLMSLIITLTGTAFIGIWHEEIVRLIFQDSTYSRALVIILATLVLELSSQVCLAYIRAIEKSTFFILLVLIKLVIQVVANTFMLVVLHMGVEGVLLGNLIAVGTGWMVLSYFTVTRCGLHFDKEKSIPVLKYSFPFLLSTMTAIVSVNIDKFLLSRMISLEAIGIYGLAMKFGLLIEQLIGEPFNRAYGAFRFSIMNRDDSSEIQASIVRYLMIGGAFVSLGIVFYVPDLLHIISDEKYWPAINIIPLLVVANLLKLLYYPFQTGILVEKKTRYIFYTGLAAATTSVLSNVVMIYYFGILGACISQTIIVLVLIVTTNIISQRYYKVDYEYRKMFGLLIVTMLFYFASISLPVYSLILNITVKAALLFAYVIVIMSTGILRKNEKEYMMDWIKRKLLKKIMSQ